MIGLAELLLFAAPFAAFAAWRVLGRRATPLVLAAASAAVLALAATGVVLAIRQRGGRDEVYVPARLQDGVVVPGHVEPAAAGHARR